MGSKSCEVVKYVKSYYIDSSQTNCIVAEK